MPSIREELTVIEPAPMPNFVETKCIEKITDQALACIEAGFPIHFRGPTGTGKTTMALHVANKIGRPVVLIHGDEEARTSDLVGGEYGYKMKKEIDNFIRSVLKTKE
ncbi:MAG: AAA family ATPase, partial [Candidatus Binatia bacterium]